MTASGPIEGGADCRGGAVWQGVPFASAPWRFRQAAAPETWHDLRPAAPWDPPLGVLRHPAVSRQACKQQVHV